MCTIIIKIHMYKMYKNGPICLCELRILSSFHFLFTTNANCNLDSRSRTTEFLKCFAE
uniref:Uncharacterized protein n=1 Tax=Anguilla anguilla TaxID=7936 RepID=A0A0E9XU80_ANGAN